MQGIDQVATFTTPLDMQTLFLNLEKNTIDVPAIDSNDVMQSYYVACLQHLASNHWHGSSAEMSSTFLVYCQVDIKSKLLVGLWLCGTRHNSYLPKHGRRVKSHL